MPENSSSNLIQFTVSFASASIDSEMSKTLAQIKPTMSQKYAGDRVTAFALKITSSGHIWADLS